MGIKLETKHLQTDKYNYIWNRDVGDGKYIGKLDRIKIDKDEGYEVLLFIQELMNKYGLKSTNDVSRIEDALHSKKLSSIVMRDDLAAKIATMLSL